MLLPSWVQGQITTRQKEPQRATGSHQSEKRVWEGSLPCHVVLKHQLPDSMSNAPSGRTERCQHKPEAQVLPATQWHSQTSAQQAHTKRGLSLYSTHNAQGHSWQKRPNCDPNNKCTHSTKQILDSMIIQSHLASKTRWNNQYSWPQWSHSKTVILRDFCSTMPVYMNCMWLTHDYCAPVSGPLLCHYIS